MEWGKGRYEPIGEQIAPAAEVVVATAAPTEGETVVDLGCGTGNGALLAAERDATVIGVDPAQRLLDVAAARFEERGLSGEFRAGDAASMPVDEASADVVISVFGVIFAPDPEAAAAEIDRVLAADGRLVLSAWIPEGAIFAAIKERREAVAAASDEPPGPPPFAWQDADALGELFGPRGFSVSMEEQTIDFEANSAREFAEGEFENHPRWVAAREMLGPARSEELRDREMVIYEEANEAQSGFRVTSRYVVASLTR
jgi:SAM-dependent methyltransferase